MSKRPINIIQNFTTIKHKVAASVAAEKEEEEAKKHKTGD